MRSCFVSFICVPPCKHVDAYNPAPLSACSTPTDSNKLRQSARDSSRSSGLWCRHARHGLKSTRPFTMWKRVHLLLQLQARQQRYISGETRHPASVLSIALYHIKLLLRLFQISKIDSYADRCHVDKRGFYFHSSGYRASISPRNLILTTSLSLMLTWQNNPCSQAWYSCLLRSSM